jgi:hypothetical protein
MELIRLSHDHSFLGLAAVLFSFKALDIYYAT